MPITFENIFDVSSTETKGRIEQLVRKGYVYGLESVEPDAYVSEVYSSAAVPDQGSEITVKGNTLTLTGRAVSASSGEGKGMAMVTLTYERSGEEDGPDPSSGVVRKGGKSSLRQIRTPVDRDGNAISVSYDGGTAQTGEISVFVPQAEPYVETIESTNDPDALMNAWVGYVNSSSWRGKPAGQWIVSGVTYEEYDTTGATNKWRFVWNFQLAESSEGWLPIAAYVDPATNQIPDGVSIGDGLVSVPYYYERDFNTKFD